MILDQFREIQLFLDPNDGWQQIDDSSGHTYGVIDDGSEWDGTFHPNLTLETPNEDPLFAVTRGTLSAKPPKYSGIPATQDLINRDEGTEQGQLNELVDNPLVDYETPPETVDLYLYPMWAISTSLASLTVPDTSDRVTGFCYRNVKTGSLVDSLGEQLDDPELIGLRSTSASPAGNLDRETVVELLLAGLLNVFVPLGQRIGLAGPSEDASTNEAGFAALTNQGPIDPVFFYQTNSENIVTSGLSQPPTSPMQALSNLAGQTTWPVITAESKQAAIQATEDATYAMPVLRTMKRSKGLSPDEWRTVGDNQKSLYFERLKKRTGQTDAEVPWFSFDGLDWQNVFQLEAVAEYFANLLEPWEENPSLRTPSDNLSGSEISVDATGSWWTKLELDDDVDLDDLVLNVDFIYVKADKERPNKTFRIVDYEDNVVKVEGSVDLDSDAINESSDDTEWRIDLHRTVNLLNPAGSNASVTDGENTVQLDDATRTDLHWIWRKDDGRIDATMTDMLVLGEKPDEHYPITDMDPETGEVTVDSELSVDGSDSVTSGWEIRSRPKIVLIDSLGGRIRGREAVVSDAGDDIVDLVDYDFDKNRINGNFDTIHLTDDSAGQAYRIKTVEEVSVDGNPTIRLTLHDEPNLGGDASPWYIMSGVGGRLPPLYYLMGADSFGYGHYHAGTFVLKDGECKQWFRFNSYPSRLQRYEDGDQSGSALRGNMRYEFESYRAGGSKYQNYNTKVSDALTRYTEYDGVREAAWYHYNSPPDTSNPIDVFERVPADRADESRRQPVDGGPGKTAIRFHWGPHWRRGSAARSFGCITSPSYPGLRDQLIDIYQEEHEDLEGSTDGDIADYNDINQAEAEDKWDTWDNDNDKWNSKWNHWRFKVVGDLWVIRPDQRPTEEQ